MEFFFLIFGMTKLLRFRKKCLLRPTSYIHEINFTKKIDLKYFENQNFFYFLIENFMPTKKCCGCLFSILSILRVVKILVRMIKKIIFFEKVFLMYNIVFSRNVFFEKNALKDDSFYLRKLFERSKKN